MMKAANPGVSDPKKWKPPSGYKSALGKARDAMKATAAKTKGKVSAVRESDDTASEDGDSDEDAFSQCGTFVIKALRPAWTKAHTPPTSQRSIAAKPVVTPQASIRNASP